MANTFLVCDKCEHPDSDALHTCGLAVKFPAEALTDGETIRTIVDLVVDEEADTVPPSSTTMPPALVLVKDGG